MPNYNNHGNHFIRLFFAAGTGLSFLLFRRQAARSERERQRLLTEYVSEQERLNAAASQLLEFLVDIVNAASLGGENEYLLAKRLNLILSVNRGEGRTLRDAFTRLADFCCAGFITSLTEQCPELTINERSICGMMVIGMEPGTICKVCGYEHEQTFYNKRKEIRRKLGLEHPVQLDGYMREWIARLLRERATRIDMLKS